MIAGFSGFFLHDRRCFVDNFRLSAVRHDFRICVIAGFSGVFLRHHQDLLRVAISLSNHFMRSLPSDCNFSISKRQLREKNITRTDVFVLSRAMR